MRFCGRLCVGHQGALAQMRRRGNRLGWLGFGRSGVGGGVGFGFIRHRLDRQQAAQSAAIAPKIGPEPRNQGTARSRKTGKQWPKGSKAPLCREKKQMHDLFHCSFFHRTGVTSDKGPEDLRRGILFFRTLCPFRRSLHPGPAQRAPADQRTAPEPSSIRLSGRSTTMRPVARSTVGTMARVKGIRRAAFKVGPLTSRISPAP